jgi:hypothetical protein
MRTWLRGWEDKGGGARPTQQRRDSPCANTATNSTTVRGIDGVAGRDDQAAAPGRERSDAAAQGREVEATRRRERQRRSASARADLAAKRQRRSASARADPAATVGDRVEEGEKKRAVTIESS